jgi:hypothetical protein
MKQSRLGIARRLGIIVTTLLVAAAVSGSAHAASVATEWPDYAPGDTVVIFGSGWLPGETVTLTISEDGGHCGDHVLSAVADENGDLYNDDFVIQDGHIGMTFTLTAFGETSGLTAETSFTDACPAQHEKDSGCTPAGAGACAVGCRQLVGLRQCNPTATAPVDAGTSCRASAGTCDVAEVCDGTSETCPSDTLVTAGTVCRTATDECDVAESCTGSSAACPDDGFADSSVECRAANGECDVAETCTGSSASCPADGIVDAGVTCRESDGDCDVEEVCDGVSSECPADEVADAGVTCRESAGDCDVEEVCDGVFATCPADAYATVGAVCRPAAGECDVEETCEGAVDCPDDEFVAAGEPCGDTVTDTECDKPDTCDGAGTCDDGLEPTTTVCRDAADDCDAVEYCDGVGECPTDELQPDDTPCDDESVCTQTDTCQAGECVGADEINCDDSLSCTTDTCDPTDACQWEPDDSACSDGNVCTADVCDADADASETTTGCVYTLDPTSGCEASVTDSSLCPFDFDPDSDPDSQFRLIFTPDQNLLTSSKLSASNPGQFYYNAMYVGPGEETIEIELPFPFVTKGGNPVHVYDSVTPEDDGCFTPGDEVASAKTFVTLEDYDPQEIGSTATVGVELPALSGNFAYINIHLDFGLKKTAGYAKNSQNDAVDEDTLDPIIPDQTDYEFADSTGGSDTAQSLNEFKRTPGFAGLVTDNLLAPVAGVKVEIYGATDVLLKTVYTDADGWYFWQYKHKGKEATFKIELPDEAQEQSVALKANQLVVVNFELP